MKNYKIYQNYKYEEIREPKVQLINKKCIDPHYITCINQLQMRKTNIYFPSQASFWIESISIFLFPSSPTKSRLYNTHTINIEERKGNTGPKIQS